MEEESYLEYYLPFAKTRLTKLADFADEKNNQPIGFLDDSNNRLIGKFFPKFLKNLEEFSGPAYRLEGDASNPLPQRWWPIFEYLNDKKIISGGANFARMYCDEPKTIRVTAALHPDFASFLNTDGRIPERGTSAHGDSNDLEEALSKLVGEIMERYSLLVYKNKDLKKASIGTLLKEKKDFLDLRLLARHTEEQKKNNSRYDFSKKSIFAWSKGKSLFTGRKKLIPSQLIFWNYNFSLGNGQEPILREPNTNGAGGHHTLNRAILSGLYELIQRDGLLIYWLNNLAPNIIDNSTIKYEPLKNLIEEFEDFGLEVVFLDTTTDLKVPSCICLILDHSGTGPKVSMGGGCEADWNKSLYRSLIEAQGIYHWQRLRKDEFNYDYLYLEKIEHPFQNRKIGQLERTSLWANEKMFEKIQFFLKGKKVDLDGLIEEQKDFSSPEEELEYLTEKFRLFGKKEYEILYYEAKHKILDDLNYHSVKVIVPALVPLYLNEANATPNCSRVKDVPSRIGFVASEQLNPWPHPFP